MNDILNTQIKLKDILELFTNQEPTKDMNINDGIKLFLDDKRLYSRAGTINYYLTNFELISTFFKNKNIILISEINSNVLTDMIFYFRGRNNKNISINKRIKMLLSMIKFLELNDLITPLDLKFKPLPEEKTKIDVVDMDDMRSIISYLPSLNVRSRTIVLLLFTTGIRTSELINIENSNIDFKNNTIYLKFTKNKAPRYTPFLPVLSPLLKQLININNGSKWLFQENDTHITAYAVKSLLRRIKKTLNIETLSAHKLRHLYATTLLKSGSDIKSVSLLLGHKSTRMTERYLDITDTDIFEKNKVFNPLNQTNFKG